MTLQQLRCLCEVVDQQLSISRAARALHTTQPAVTRMIHKLEGELDVQLLVRLGSRIIAITDEGSRVVEYARTILRNVRDLRAAAIDAKGTDKGVLRIATTSIQARYALLNVVHRFAAKYPDVTIDVTQCPLPQALPPNVYRLFAYPIKRCIVTPARHPLLRSSRPRLADVAKYPLIAYSTQLEIGAAIRDTFDRANLKPKITIHTTDVELVKSYVRLGLGIAVIQEMAFDAERDTDLRKIDASHLFPSSSSWITLRRDQYLRQFLYDFIYMISAKLTRQEVDRARRTKDQVAS
jgi:LysR family cys regulon transcriptional activator